MICQEMTYSRKRNHYKTNQQVPGNIILTGISIRKFSNILQSKRCEINKSSRKRIKRLNKRKLMQRCMRGALQLMKESILRYVIWGMGAGHIITLHKRFRLVSIAAQKLCLAQTMIRAQISGLLLAWYLSLLRVISYSIQEKVKITARQMIISRK